MSKLRRKLGRDWNAKVFNSRIQINNYGVPASVFIQDHGLAVLYITPPSKAALRLQV